MSGGQTAANGSHDRPAQIITGYHQLAGSGPAKTGGGEGWIDRPNAATHASAPVNVQQATKATHARQRTAESAIPRIVTPPVTTPR